MWNRAATAGVLGTSLAVILTTMPSVGDHKDCVIGVADPATYHVVHAPNGNTYYLEERGEPLPGPPIPGTGFLLGEATWLYREWNGFDGLTRGTGLDLGLIECVPPPPFACVLTQDDPLLDEHCGHGPDWEVFGLDFDPGFPPP